MKLLEETHISADGHSDLSIVETEEKETETAHNEEEVTMTEVVIYNTPDSLGTQTVKATIHRETFTRTIDLINETKTMNIEAVETIDTTYTVDAYKDLQAEMASDPGLSLFSMFAVGFMAGVFLFFIINLFRHGS